MEQTGQGDLGDYKAMPANGMPTTAPQYVVTLVYYCSAVTLILCVPMNPSLPSLPYRLIHQSLPLSFYRSHLTLSTQKCPCVKLSTFMGLYLATVFRKVRVNSGRKGRGFIRQNQCS